MTFGPSHYLPVLKVKRGEKAALKAVAPLVQTKVTPLLEFVERKPEKGKGLTEHLDTAFKDLADSVQLFPRCLIDTRELAPDGAGAAEEVFDRAAKAGIRFTPVTGILRSHDLQAAMRHRANGVALRLTRAEFESGLLTKQLTAFMTQHVLRPDQVDLIADLGELDAMVSAGVFSLTRAFLAAIPIHLSWKTLTVSGCSFPPSMGSVKRDSFGFVDRVEWVSWRDHLYANRRGLQRLPAFSDGAIQHPSGVEGFDPKTMSASAAVRYTLRDRWLLIKGQSTKTMLPRIQFQNLATRLVHGDLSANFAGEGHCPACAGMKAAAAGAPKLGSLEAWRRLGTIHHIIQTVQNLDSLPWP